MLVAAELRFRTSYTQKLILLFVAHWRMVREHYRLSRQAAAIAHTLTTPTLAWLGLERQLHLFVCAIPQQQTPVRPHKDWQYDVQHETRHRMILVCLFNETFQRTVLGGLKLVSRKCNLYLCKGVL